MKHTMRICENKEIAADIYRLSLEGNEKITYQPGQFINIRINEAGLFLRRPFSISYHQGSQLIILYKLEGKGTDWLSKQAVNQSLDILGPLGHGFKPIQNGQAVLIGGGIGIAPLLGLIEELHRQNTTVHLYAGYQSQPMIYESHRLESADQLTLETMDGSTANRGSILSWLPDIDVNTAIYSCGPRGFLRALMDRFPDHHNLYVSLEERMGCGVGLCYGCTCHGREADESRLICTDGPVFNAKEINYD